MRILRPASEGYAEAGRRGGTGLSVHVCPELPACGRAGERALSARPGSGFGQGVQAEPSGGWARRTVSVTAFVQ